MDNQKLVLFNGGKRSGKRTRNRLTLFPPNGGDVVEFHDLRTIETDEMGDFNFITEDGHRFKALMPVLFEEWDDEETPLA
jgi:hypothetical protein